MSDERPVKVLEGSMSLPGVYTPEITGGSSQGVSIITDHKFVDSTSTFNRTNSLYGVPVGQVPSIKVSVKNAIAFIEHFYAPPIDDSLRNSMIVSSLGPPEVYALPTPQNVPEGNAMLGHRGGGVLIGGNYLVSLMIGSVPLTVEVLTGATVILETVEYIDRLLFTCIGINTTVLVDNEARLRNIGSSDVKKDVVELLEIGVGTQLKFLGCVAIIEEV